jgi:hypothetical protein
MSQRTQESRCRQLKLAQPEIVGPQIHRNATRALIWPTMPKPQNGRGRQWSAVIAGAFTPALVMIVGSRAIWITPWSASDGSRLTSGPDKSFSIAMWPGVSVAPSEAAERCTAAVAVDRSRVSASEPAGRSGVPKVIAVQVKQIERDRHDLSSLSSDWSSGVSSHIRLTAFYYAI